MKYKFIITTAIAAITAIASAPNFAQSKEDQCLQSASLSFKDPGSLKEIKNLGNRGQRVGDSEFFWLRYSATNSYGGRVAASMACKKAGDGWVRDLDWENTSVAKVQKSVDDMIDQEASNYKPPPCQGFGFGCAEAQRAARTAVERYMQKARIENARFGQRMVLSGFDDLSD